MHYINKLRAHMAIVGHVILISFYIQVVIPVQFCQLFAIVFMKVAERWNLTTCTIANGKTCHRVKRF